MWAGGGAAYSPAETVTADMAGALACGEGHGGTRLQSTVRTGVHRRETTEWG